MRTLHFPYNFYIITNMITLQQEESMTKRKQEFEEKLGLIEIKYDRWFSGRINPFTGDADHVQNYFRYIENNEGDIKLYLKDGLPIEIGKDCRQAFSATFAS
jgi:hypothetical protein